MIKGIRKVCYGMKISASYARGVFLKCRAFVVSRKGRRIQMDHEGELKVI